MALFGRKNNDDSTEVEGDGWKAEPEKARKWFDHARTSADASNYEYALKCYANAFRLDPSSLDRHEAMFDVARRYRENGGKPASGKEVREFAGKDAVSRFAAAEFEWLKDLENFKLAQRALEAAVEAGQLEFGKWMSRFVIALMRKQKRIGKSQLKSLIMSFQEVGAFDFSMQVAEMAKQLDPTDNEIDALMKDLSAQQAIERGRFDQEGDFRDSILDASKQQELLEEETLAGGSSEERNLARARKAYEDDPSVPDHINKFAQLVKKPGTPEALEQAHEVYMRGYETVGEYRFRMVAGDIRIEQAEARLRKCREKHEATPEDAELAAAFEQAQHDLLALQSDEYTERVAKYPTDRIRKFDLGRVQYALGNYDDAMAQFQSAKDEPKLHARAAHMLGRCFMAESWYGEAIAEYKEALHSLEVTEKDRELEFRYDLMLALMEQSRDERTGDTAREAKEICSEIARKNITYRDIRQKRREIDELIKEVG